MKQLLLLLLLATITLSAVVPDSVFVQDSELSEFDDMDEREGGEEEDKKFKEKDAIDDFLMNCFDPCRYATNKSKHFKAHTFLYKGVFGQIDTPPPELV